MTSVETLMYSTRAHAPVYWCAASAEAHGRYFTGRWPIGCPYSAPSPRLAVRWCQRAALYLADQLRPQTGHRSQAEAWLADPADLSAALTKLREGRTVRYRTWDECAYYQVTAEPFPGWSR